jgi:hypothetical protein
MTKQQKIKLLMALSRIEGAMYQLNPEPQPFLFNDLSECVDIIKSLDDEEIK